jgi:hypothetical protein
MSDGLSPSIFTIEVDRQPVVAFACRKHSEAEEMSADERVRAKLRLMNSGGRPLAATLRFCASGLRTQMRGQSTTKRPQLNRTIAAC